MSRIFAAILLGGVLFGSAFSQADSGQHYGNYWPSSDATVVAQADPRPMPAPVPMPPPAPKAPAAPAAPRAPAAPHAAGSGVSVQIHDGKIQIDGVSGLVDGAIREAQNAIKTSGLPADVRDKLQKRLDKVKDTVKSRLSHLDASNLDQLGDELSKMGDDIGKQMDEFGKEMEKYGEQVNKDSMKKFGKDWSSHGAHFKWDSKDKDDDEDDETDLPSTPDVDDADELDDAVKSLGDLSLKPPQRDQIQKLRADSDRQVAAAKKQLDQASDTLKKQLDNSATSDADIARSIDAVTQQEAAIRKARILAWHGARRVLDDAQRKKVEDTAAKAKKGH